MSELAADLARRIDARSTFYFWMAAAMAVVVFVGFGITYLQPMAAGSLRPISPIVHVHGAFYFAWMILLVVQSGLINLDRISRHRSLGIMGIALATGMVLTGCTVTLLFANSQVAASDPTAYGLMYTSLMALVVFGALFTLAIGKTRDPQTHRRLILLATVGVLGAAINRILVSFLGLQNFDYLAIYLVMNTFILVLAVHDWRTLGRVHSATLIGAAVNIIPQCLQVPIATSGAFVDLTHWLAGLAHYG
jgi:FtsH-binding integral membrane protein